MDLNSEQDISLLKNCIKLHIETLKLNKNFSEAQDSLDIYEKIFNYLKNGDIENVKNMISSSINTQDFSNFGQYITSTSSEDVANHFFDEFKKVYENSEFYDEEKLNVLENKFLKSADISKENETDDSKIGLNNSIEEFNKKLKKGEQKILQKTMPPSEFKSFSESFRDYTKKLGIKIFQPYFDGQSKTITDMKISLSKDSNSREVYKTDFSLKDNLSQESHVVLTEPALTTIPILSYYQALCFSYLQAEKCANMENTFMDLEFMEEKMKDFKECYDKLKEMSKFKISIGANNKIIISDKSNIEPSEELEFDSTSDKEDYDSISL